MNKYNFKAALLSRITKPPGTLCDEETLIWHLRRRLTKKEYKILHAAITGSPDSDTLRARLRLDSERHEALLRSAEKKLNSDTLKRELFC